MTDSLPPRLATLVDALPICPKGENGFGSHDMKRVTTGSPLTHEWICGKCPTTIEMNELDTGGAWVRMVDAHHQVTTSSHGPQPIAVVEFTEGAQPA